MEQLDSETLMKELVGTLGNIHPDEHLAIVSIDL